MRLRLWITVLRVTGWASLCAAGVLSLTCRPPALIDPMGRPVNQPLRLASIEYGRIVIDSSSERIRAVLELTRSLPDSIDQEAPSIPLLRCSARTSLLAPVGIRREPVTCRRALMDGGCAAPGQGNACAYRNSRLGQFCSQVLHIEYRLDVVPSVGDSVTLELGDRVSHGRWARP